MNSNLEHMIWVEKYRPLKIADCILPENLQKTFQSIVDSGTMPNLLLSGGAGTGKTTAALAMCKELGYDVLFINGSNEGRLLETLRNKIVAFASTMSFEGTRKVVLIDEADYMPRDTIQVALRSITEEFSKNCSFILTCNFPQQIIEPLHSRCTHIEYQVPANEKKDIAAKFFKRVVAILNEEKVTFDNAAVAEVVKKFFPDFRRTLNELQRYSKTGKITTEILANTSNQEIDVLIGFLKQKNFKEMRKWVATTQSLDLVTICRKLYDASYDIMKPECIPQLVLDIADAQYKNTFVADKEIALVAFLTTVMINSEWV